MHISNNYNVTNLSLFTLKQHVPNKTYHLSQIIVFTNSVGAGPTVMVGPSTQHDVASEILAIGPIQLDDLSETDLVTPITITASPSASGQQILTTVTTTASG